MPVYRVADDASKAALDGYDGRIAIIRPDRYVAGIAPPAAFPAVTDALDRLLGWRIH